MLDIAHVPPIGITMAATRGARTVYKLAGSRGLEALSVGYRAISDLPHAFQARLISVPLEELAVEDLTATAHTASRTSADAAVVPWDLLRFLFVVKGQIEWDEPARVRLETGDTALHFVRGPFRYRFGDGTRIVSLSVPRTLLRSDSAALTRHEFTRLESSSLTTLLSAMVRTISAHAPDDNTPEAELLSHALIDIAQGVISTLSESTEAGRHTLRRRAYDIIERDYSDPALRASAIAHRLRVSERHLHRLFAEEPLSIAHRIRSRRTEAAARQLLATHDAFDIIARRVGFGSADSAYRSFRDVFGVSPSEYRRRGRWSPDAHSEQSHLAGR